MRRTIKSLLTLVTVAVFSACSDSSGPNGGGVVGSYALITINGLGLPVVIYSDQLVTYQINSGDLILNSNNTFSTTGSYTETLTGAQPTTVTDTCTGTYTVSGNTVTFNEATSTTGTCGGVYNATWDGSNSLTVAFDVTVQAVFQK